MGIAQAKSSKESEAKQRPNASTRRIFLTLGLAGLYLAFAKFGFLFAYTNPSVTTIWPPTGLAIAAVLIWGLDIWPGIFLGAFLANVVTAGTAATSIGIAAGNTLEALTAAYLVNKYARGRHAFEEAGDVSRFAMFAGIMATGLSATIGVATLILGGLTATTHLFQNWLTWWLGDMSGALIAAPLILLWANQPRFQWTEQKKKGLPLLALIIAASYFLFYDSGPFVHGGYLIIPPLIGVAFVMGRRITSAMVALVAVIASVATIHGFGPFVVADKDLSLVLLQVFMGIVSISTLMFAALHYKRSAAKKELAAKEEFFQSLIENSYEAMSLVDAEGKIIYASPSTKNVCGYTPEELVGRSRFEVVAPEERDRALDMLREVVENPRASASMEERIRCRDGSIKWVESTYTNMLANPAVQAVVINFRDITERKELAYAKSNFVSSVSYRLNPPISKIETYLDPLLKNKSRFSPLEQKYLEEIALASRKMAALTNDLLRLTRLELGTIDTQVKPVDACRVVDLTVVGLTDRIQSKSLEMEKKYPSSRISFLADPNLLALVLQRLLSQIIETVPIGSTMRIAIEKREPDIAIKISSPSVGSLRQKLQISAAKPADAEKSDAALGFHVVQSLVELMDGRIYFEPRYPEGETVILTLPSTQKRWTPKTARRPAALA